MLKPSLSSSGRLKTPQQGSNSPAIGGALELPHTTTTLGNEVRSDASLRRVRKSLPALFIPSRYAISAITFTKVMNMTLLPPQGFPHQ